MIDEKKFEDLEKILKKDPIINTKHASEIVETPNTVENYYKFHASTHMPLSDTEDYFSQMLTWVTKNKGVLVGGVVGGYGLGKTSLMVYYWHRSQQENLMAIPPYSWDTIQDHIDAAYYWSKYYFSKVMSVNSSILKELDSLYSGYRLKTLEEEAEKLSNEAGIPKEKALSYLQTQADSGRLRLDYSEEDLINYYQALTEIIIKSGLKGLIIFTDEIQQTVDSGNTSFKEMASKIFRIVNGLGAREGNFGIFFGMPQTFQARLSKERGDILDRLQKQKCFIDLSQMYHQSFPMDLWDSYVVHFDLQDVTEEVIDRNALVSIGQVCDSRRPDLGNGPRSVISAFNMMVLHFKEHHAPYQPEDFVNDCLEGEITLGDRSSFTEQLGDLLSQPYVVSKYEDVVKFLAAFPQGTTESIEVDYQVQQSIREFIKDSGGLGKVVTNAPGKGHLLSIFKPNVNFDQEDPLASYLSNFYNEYNPDRRHINSALSVFMQEIIPTIFFERNQTEIIGWIAEDDKWKNVEWGYQITLKGTFEEAADFPFRRIRIEVPTLHSKAPHLELGANEIQFRAEKDPLDFVMRFHINLDINKSDGKGYIEFDKWPSRVVNIHINPFYFEEHRRIDRIHNSIPQESCYSFLYLNLINYMNGADLSSDSKQHWDAVRQDIIRSVINMLFNDGLLNVVGADLDLDNKGHLLIKDLFAAMCRANYPEYRTIINSRGYEKKLDAYKMVLKSQEIQLAVKRGKEPLRFSEQDGTINIKYSKAEIARLFGLKGHADFDKWVGELGPLIDVENWDSGELYLKLHPIEEKIVSQLESSKATRTYGGKECRCIEGKPILKSEALNGYRYSELETIINEIGPSRKLFQIDKDEGILYKPPESLEELRKEAEDRLDRLTRDIETIKLASVEFVPPICRDLIKQVKGIKDEETAETTLARLRQERIKLDSTLVSLINSSFVALDKAIKSINLDVQQQDSKLNALLKRSPESPAVWIQSLAAIQKILDKSYSRVKSAAMELSREGAAIANSIKTFPTAPNNEVEEFTTINKKITEINNKMANEIKPEATVVINQVLYLEKWFDVATSYKIAFDRTSALEQSIGDASLQKEFESASMELKTFLDDEREKGLKDWEAHKTKIEGISVKALQQITQFRNSFNSFRKTLSDELKNATGKDVPLHSTFEELDVQNSYLRLGEECLDSLSNNLQELNNELNDLNTDIQYSKLILGLDKEIRDLKLGDRAQSISSQIIEIKSTMSGPVFSKVENANAIKAIASDIKKVWADYRAVRLELKRIQVSKPVSKDASELVEFVSKAPQRNLKDAILEMTGRKADADLDTILDLMKECFKNQQIEIILKRKV